MLKGKYTILAVNSVGSKKFPYVWDTNILEINKKENDEVELIHKPCGTNKTHTDIFNKEDELKIYNGWLRTTITNDIYVNFEDLKKINQDPVYSL